MYYIADVCGTLVKDDTTVGLLKWHFARSRRWRLWLLLLLTSRFSPVRLLFVVAEKATGTHLLKHRLVGLLRGDSVADVQESADQYADWLLAHRKVGGVWNLLEQKNGDAVLLLASASVAPVVRALAARLGADYVASVLATKDGRHLGRYESDLTGLKIEALDRHLPSGWRLHSYIAISDNLTDRCLLQGAQQAYVVLHNDRQRQRWGNMRAKYISI